MLMQTEIGLRQGYGQHYEILGEEYATNFFKNLFVGEILYALVICLVKFSILAFYWRLFAATIRVPCYILGFIVTSWGVAVVSRVF